MTVTIIAPLPFTLQDGTTADATEVMANLNRIRNDVNNNVPASNAIVLNDDPETFYNGQGEFTTPGYRGAAVYNTATPQLIANGASAAVQFDTEIVDTDSIFSLSSPTRLTVPAGVTRVRLSAYVTPNSGVDPEVINGKYLMLRLYKNGSQLDPPITIARINILAIANYSAPLIFNIVSPPVTCVAGDYFTLVFDNFTSTSLYVTPSDSRFEMQILG